MTKSNKLAQKNRPAVVAMRGGEFAAPFPKTLIGFYWAMLKKFKWYAIIVIGFSSAWITYNTVVGPLLAKYTLSIFDSNIPDFWPHAIQTFWLVAILTFALWPIYLIKSYADNSRQPRVGHYIREELINYAYNNDYKWFLEKNVGAIQGQIERIRNGFFKVTTTLLDRLIGTVFGLVLLGGILFNINIYITMVILAWGFIRLGYIIKFSAKNAKMEAEVSKLSSKNSGTISDSILNYMNIKLFSSSSYEREYIGRERDTLIRKTFNAWKFRFSRINAMDFLNDMLHLAITFGCIILFANGELTLPEFGLIETAFFTVSRRFQQLAESYNKAMTDWADAKQAWDEIIVPRQITNKPNAPDLMVKRGELDLRGISFKYNKDWVVHNLSLKIKPGERVGIVGLSGAGKTTLSHLLLRLFDVQRGGIYIDGQNIKNVAQDGLRNSIAFVPQDPVLFNRTLGENIGYAKPDATAAEIERAARLANIHDFIMSTADKYDTVVGNRGIKLSGGQRQRIAIARAILKNAPILILDEATSSLDSDTEATIQKSFDTLMKNRTTVVIAHRLSTLRKMDRIIVMENGGIAEQGTHAALLKKPGGIYARLWKMQSGGFIKE